MILITLLLALVPQQGVIGDWKGTSLCKAYKPVCKDEVVVYHIKALPKSGRVEFTANKIVNGVEEDMGVLTCDVDASAHSLTCPMPKEFRPGLWKFTWRGDTMTGTLTEPGGKLVRQVNVTRAGSK
jgi:hypothetical protein